MSGLELGICGAAPLGVDASSTVANLPVVQTGGGPMDVDARARHTAEKHDSRVQKAVVCAMVFRMFRTFRTTVEEAGKGSSLCYGAHPVLESNSPES